MKQFNKSTLALLVVLCVTSFSGMSAMARRVGASLPKTLVPMGVRGMFTKEGKIYALNSERSNPKTADELKGALFKGKRVYVAQDGLANYLVNPNDFSQMYVPITSMHMNVDGEMVYTKENPIMVGRLTESNNAPSLDEDQLADFKQGMRTMLSGTEPYDNPYDDMKHRHYSDEEIKSLTAKEVMPNIVPTKDELSKLRTFKDLQEKARRKAEEAKAVKLKMNEEFIKDPFAQVK